MIKLCVNCTIRCYTALYYTDEGEGAIKLIINLVGVDMMDVKYQ